MSAFMTVLKYAERAADGIVEIKDFILGGLADVFIPKPEKRPLVRRSIRKFVRKLPITNHLSDIIDKGIDRDVITVSNLLSLSRIPAGLFYLMLINYNAGWEWYILILLWALLSDLFDGILARKMGQVTDLGAALDAGCDKIFAGFVAISYWSIIWQWWWNALLFFILDGFLLLTSIVIFVLKNRGQYHGQAQVKSNNLGKLKFCLQGTACLCYLLWYTNLGHYCLLTANFFSVGSIIRHLSPKK